MPADISFAASTDDLDGFADLTRRYLEWDLAAFEKTTGIRLSVDEYVANTLEHLEEYWPPSGRLILARDASGALIGMVLLRSLEAKAGEIKRLYVDPVARGTGLGQRLMAFLLSEARQIGYRTLYLDSASYMPAAHRLYRNIGFEETGPYTGSENDPALAPYLLFMKLSL